MIVAFTGTRSGMTPAQRATVEHLLAELAPVQVRHGDCKGSDDEFANLCAALTPRPRIIAHPGESKKDGTNLDRAFNPHSDEVRPVKTHFARNRDMVDVANVLIGTPLSLENQDAGGTWYTVTYARRKGGVRVLVVKPDGGVWDSAAVA